MAAERHVGHEHCLNDADESGGASRRQFLASLAAIGAASLLPQGTAMAETGKLAFIDTHHHFYAPEYQKAWVDWEDQRKLPHSPGQAAWTPAMSIAEMEKNGIRTSLLSLPSTPGMWFDHKAPRPRSRWPILATNTAPRWPPTIPAASDCSRTLPMVDVDATLKEIELRFRHAQGGWRRPADQLRRQMAGRSRLCAGVRGVEPAQGLVYFHPLVAACCGQLSVGTFPR